jgi:hypothetical protein
MKKLIAGLATFTWRRKACTVRTELMDAHRETWVASGTGPTRERALAKALRVPEIVFSERDADVTMCKADMQGRAFRFIAVNGNTIIPQ